MKYLLFICIILGIGVLNGVLLRQKGKLGSKMGTVKTVSELFDVEKDGYCAAKMNLGLFKFKVKTFGKMTLDPYARKVANDQAAWTFDALDPLMINIAMKDFKESWNFYKGQKRTGLNPFFEDGEVSPLSDEEQKHILGYQQISNGMTEGGILPVLKGRTIKEIITDYDMNGDHFLNYQEFNLMMLELTSKTMIPLKCQNCLENSRKELKTLFEYLDCDKDGIIDSEDLWNGWKEMKSFELFTTACTNDLLLKCDTNNDAQLTPQEFIEGILHGYWEREVSVDGPSYAFMQLKKVREANYEAKKKKAKSQA